MAYLHGAARVTLNPGSRAVTSIAVAIMKVIFISVAVVFLDLVFPAPNELNNAVGHLTKFQERMLNFTKTLGNVTFVSIPHSDGIFRFVSFKNILLLRIHSFRKN